MLVRLILRAALVELARSQRKTHRSGSTWTSACLVGFQVGRIYDVISWMESHITNNSFPSCRMDIILTDPFRIVLFRIQRKGVDIFFTSRLYLIMLLVISVCDVESSLSCSIQRGGEGDVSCVWLAQSLHPQ